MEKHFEDLLQIRRNFIDILEDYDLSHLTYIPKGFKNNIFWNCAHALVTQQLIHYYLSNNEMLVEPSWIARFKKGTLGSDDVSKNDVNYLIKSFVSTAKQLERDYNSEKLSFYKPYETSFGTYLENIEDAIRYNNIHEALHLGYILAIKKCFN